MRNKLTLVAIALLLLAGCASMEPEYRDFFYGDWGMQHGSE